MKPLWIACLVLLAVTAARASAESSAESPPQFSPASFDHEESKRRLAGRIEFPEIKGDTSVTLSCFSVVERNGKIKETGCIAKDSFHAAFAAAVSKAAKKAEVTPALIDGKAQKVYLQFRAEFIAKGEDRQIVLYPNPGYQENIDAYGADYVAAQRVIGEEPWQDVCPQRAGFLVLARAFVGEDGRAQSPSLERLSGIMPAPNCQEAIEMTILGSRYTPAMADGYPVPSAFVEMFGN